MLIQLIKQLSTKGEIGFMMYKDETAIEWFDENREEEARKRFQEIRDNFNKKFEPEIIMQFDSEQPLEEGVKYLELSPIAK